VLARSFDMANANVASDSAMNAANEQLPGLISSWLFS